MVQNEVLWQKQAIFCIFLCNGQNDQIRVVFGKKLHFQPYKSKIFIKQYLIFIIWEIVDTKILVPWD